MFYTEKIPALGFDSVTIDRSSFRLPLGPLHKILPAGLGHASLASFTVHKKNALPKAR
jgi:hypothetical protein